MEHNYRAELLMLDGSSRIVGIRTDRIYRRVAIHIDGKTSRFRFVDIRHKHLVYRQLDIDPDTGKEVRVCPACRIRPIKDPRSRLCADCGRESFQDKKNRIAVKKGVDRR